MPNATTNNSLSKICNTKSAIRQPPLSKTWEIALPTPLGQTPLFRAGCMCITVLVILLIFTSPEGYRLAYSFPFHVHISCIGLRYGSVLANTAVLCMRASFVCRYVAPLVSVITTLYYFAKTIFHRRVWYRAFSLRYAFEVRASSSSHRVPSCQISFLSRPSLLSYSPCRKIAYTESFNHPAYLMAQKPKLALRNLPDVVTRSLVCLSVLFVL